MFEFAFSRDVITLTVKLGVIVHFVSSIKSVLGLSDIHYLGDQKYTSKMVSTIDFLYVYCDIVDYGSVSDTMATLLQAIPVAGKDKFWVVERYESPHYIKLLKLNFSTIEIEISL